MLIDLILLVLLLFVALLELMDQLLQPVVQVVQGLVCPLCQEHDLPVVLIDQYMTLVPLQILGIFLL
jgi:hypothetical protein